MVYRVCENLRTSTTVMDPKLSSAYDGKPRWLWPKTCTQCSVLFWVPKNQLTKRSTCSVECRGREAQRRTEVSCATCGAPVSRALNKFRSKSKLYFCSRKCKDEAQRIEGLPEIQPEHYGAGPQKAYLIRLRGHRCEGCDLTEWCGVPIALEVHHIDGQSDNNALGNRQLLCPNCHAQTPNYRGRKRT